MLEVAKWLGAPGSLRLLGVLISVTTVLWIVRPRWRRGLIASSLAIAATYLLLALPPVAHAIESRLPMTAPVPAGAIDRLVIFDGDNRRGRARVGIALIKERQPTEIWVIGMGWLVEALSDAGIPRTLIHHWAAPTTSDQVKDLREIVSRSPAPRTAVIVSRLQAPRTEALLRAAKLDVSLIASPADQEPPATGIRHYLPTYLALRLSRDAIYEHAALWYYRKKGWIQ